jgi:hypothetical protein
MKSGSEARDQLIRSQLHRTAAHEGAHVDLDRAIDEERPGGGPILEIGADKQFIRDAPNLGLVYDGRV